ncbi:WD40 repeat domain-containing protein, partial [Micromonospora sp. LOL_023]
GRPVIVSASDDETVRVWDAATGTPIGEPSTHRTGWVLSVAVGQLDGRPVIVSGRADGAVRVWDAVTG